MLDEQDIEVMIGVDAHKRTHTLVAVDELGRHVVGTLHREMAIRDVRLPRGARS